MEANKMYIGALVTTAAALAVAAALGASAQLPVRTVALTGRQAPEAGAAWSAMGGPAINERGEVAFTAGVGEGDQPQLGVWVAGPAGTRLVALDGRPTPDLAGSVFSSPTLGQLSDGGHVTVKAYTTRPDMPTHSRNGLWVGRPGELRLLASEWHDPAPGTGAPFRFLPNPGRINAAGETALVGHLAHGKGATFGDDSGLWAGTPGNVRLVSRQGAEPLRVVNHNDPDINGAGRIAFSGYRRAAGGGSLEWGIWAGRGAGDLTQVLSANDPAPGLPGLRVGPPSISVRLTDAGAMAFMTRLRNEQDSTVGDALWRKDDAGLRLVARTGQAAPGAPGRTFEELAYAPELNENGRVLFSGKLDGEGAFVYGDTGIWAGTPDDVRLVALIGQEAPGTGGARFGHAAVLGPHGTKYQPAFFSIAQNDVGQVAWIGSLVGKGVDETNDTGYFAAGPDGGVVLVAREGDLLDVGGGDLRRIDRLAGYWAFTVPGSEGGEWFNNAGQLAFAATFTDGSEGVFVAVVPEPGAVVLAAAAPLLLLRRGRSTKSRRCWGCGGTV